jgi:hypothetical protein
MANVLERLTEGTVFQDKKKESAALVEKWENSGLLEGIEDDYQRGTMAVLLENQAKELLRESNTMSSGDVQGFAAVAFPIVRRVFAGLIANDLISVQPMSLPSGLVFFMDFRRATNVGNSADVVLAASSSFYGDKVGVEITGGVEVDGLAFAEKGFYNLANGYNKARYYESVPTASEVSTVAAFAVSGASDANLGRIRWDPDIINDATAVSASVFEVKVSDLTNAGALLAEQDVFSLSVVGHTSDVNGVGDASVGAALAGTNTRVIRRLTKVVPSGSANGTKALQFVVTSESSTALSDLATGKSHLVLSFPIKDKLQGVGSNALGALQGAAPWSLESSSDLPEINLKVDSFSITARSRKLKAAWTPELGQDLNAYHNLDAEVELTSILSEQIGLEIDQEILNDLIKGATAGVKYWSRRPGKFVNRNTGATLGVGDYTAPPDFTGNVSMWYETLIETINDVSAQIHRKTLRGAANFVVISPEVANILEFTAGFRATVTHDAEKGNIGAVKVGALNSKFDVIVDPYFPRNVILVGRKGGSFLESGYVYAPYVPLQTSPTIFDPDNFTPRKAVMTRYGKAMVRPDMYGLVICQDLLG